MVSMKYRFVRAVLRALPIKQILGLPPQTLRRYARSWEGRKPRRLAFPGDPSCSYENEEIALGGTTWQCMKIRPVGVEPEGALLYIYGGGMISSPDISDLRPAIALARATHRDVWVPLYPLCLDYTALDSLEMVYRCYMRMCELWEPRQIAVLGYSSGATLALGLPRWVRGERGGSYAVNTLGSEVCSQPRSEPSSQPRSQPAAILAVSPGAFSPDDPAWKARAISLVARDVLVSPRFLPSAGTLMANGTDLPSWFTRPWAGGFDGFPPCHFWFGGDEIFAASIPDFEEALMTAKVAYTVTVGEEMCHCYPFLPGPDFPEKTAALRAIAQCIRAC